MIYRLYIGAEDAWKRRVFEGAFVLSLTIGFPALAAYVTHEQYVPRPTTITQDDEPGVVLGTNDAVSLSVDSTQPPTSDESSTASAATLQRASASGTMHREHTHSQAGGSSSPSPLPIGGSGSGGEEPPPSGNSEPLISADAQVLNTADAHLEVDQNGDASAEVNGMDP